MKAIIQTRYGSAEFLQFGDLDRPEPRDDEVLVRVRAASVHADVWHVVTGLPYVLRCMGAGFRRPKQPVPGTDVAGIVESVGKGVSRFQPGDEVFGETIRGMQWVNGGAYAEFATAPENSLAKKPPGVTFEQAAAVPTSALIVLGNLQGAAKVRAGQRVLVNGAAGGVGAFALQIAKAQGAEVTAVDRPETLELMRALGADHVIDYTQEDFTQSDKKYDLLFDIPGNHSLADCRRVLTPQGHYILIGHDNYGRGMRRLVGIIPRAFRLMAMSLFVKQLRGMGHSMLDKTEGMEQLRVLLETEKLTPHVDKVFPLSEVPAAIEYLQAGKSKGKIVISIGDRS